MALDEPKTDDQKFSQWGLTFVVAPKDLQIIDQYGGADVELVEYWGQKSLSIRVHKSFGVC